ncbi:MAG TPA: HisA/HisF-related TIM barrel protein, partial [Rubrobacter sp.]|nr:HisA/HisF-related TIM barrel protein [Rubrobacter sp.]
YDREGADEIVFYDITASHQGRDTATELARRAAEEVFVPYTIGGGVRTAHDMRAMLRAGADKVSVNSAAVRTPDLIDEGAERFGSQCVVLSVDVKRRGSGSGWEVYLNGGRVNTGMDAIGWLVEGERRGAGEFVLNSMDADGTETGYDLDLIAAVAEKTTLPIVASGGAGSPEHMIAAVKAGAGAVLAASIFHFGEYSIREVKEHMMRAGIPVRLAEPRVEIEHDR